MRESMTEQDVEIILQKALEIHPGENPRIISDNGPQFIARDFKEFIRLTGITHVRTSPRYSVFFCTAGVTAAAGFFSVAFSFSAWARFGDYWCALACAGETRS